MFIWPLTHYGFSQQIKWPLISVSPTSLLSSYPWTFHLYILEMLSKPQRLLNSAQEAAWGIVTWRILTAGLPLATSGPCSSVRTEAACDICTPPTSKRDTGWERLGCFLGIQWHLQTTIWWVMNESEPSYISLRMHVEISHKVSKNVHLFLGGGVLATCGGGFEKPACDSSPQHTHVLTLSHFLASFLEGGCPLGPFGRAEWNPVTDLCTWNREIRNYLKYFLS